MAAGWKSNSKTLANTVNGLSGLFIATGSRVFGSFSTQLNPSVAATWITEVFETPLDEKSSRNFTSIDTEKRVLDTVQPTGADRSISIVSRRILRFLIPSIFSHRFLGISFSFISCDDWKTIEDNCYEIDGGWIYMLSWFGDGRNTLS